MVSFFFVCVCDYSGQEWNEVDEAEKKRIKLKKKEDGEFWYVAKTHHTAQDCTSA